MRIAFHSLTHPPVMISHKWFWTGWSTDFLGGQSLASANGVRLRSGFRFVGRFGAALGADEGAVLGIGVLVRERVDGVEERVGLAPAGWTPVPFRQGPWLGVLGPLAGVGLHASDCRQPRKWYQWVIDPSPRFSGPWFRRVRAIEVGAEIPTAQNRRANATNG